MDSRQRIISALHGQPVDHVPFCPFLAYVWEHFPAAVQQAGQLAFHQRIGADPLWRGAPCPVRAVPPSGLMRDVIDHGTTVVTIIQTPVGTLQETHQRSQLGNTSFLVEHPLKTPEDFRIQTWIEEHTRLEYDPRPAREHLQGPGRAGLSLGMLIPRGKSAYQTMVEHLVGTEELIYALVDCPDAVETLWRTMVARDLEAVRLAAASEYEYFTTWEDSSTQNYSPAQYDRYIGTEIGAWCQVLADPGKRYIQHACGHIRALVQRMDAHGVFAVESISPPPTGDVSIEETRKLVGPDFGIIGGIEPTIFLGLSLAELGAYAEEVISQGQGGPFVLANSDSGPPGVTEEKFALVAQIARDHG
jgi:hypothetical protein